MAKLTKGAGMALVIGMGVAVAGAAFAHNDKMPANAGPATKAAYARHESFEKLGANFKGIIDELKKDAPNKALIAKNAATMQTLAKGLPTWFPKGSGVEARPMSEAKAEIWTDAAGFATATSAMQAQVAKLNTLAAAGDLDGVKGQIRATGGTCKGCHDKYRQEKKD